MRHTHLRLSGISTALALLFAVSAAPAAAAGYIKFDGVKGESTASSPGQQIEILSWSWGETNASTGSGTHVGGGGGSGKVSMAAEATEAAKKKGNVEYGWKVEEAEKAAHHEAEITLKGDAARAGKVKPGRVKVGDVTLKRGTMAEANESVGGVRVASGDIDGDGGAEQAAASADKATPKLAEAIADGTAMAEPRRDGGSLTVIVPAGLCRAGARYPAAEVGTEGRTYRLTDVIVSSCASAAASGDSRPMESLSLNYTKVEWN